MAKLDLKEQSGLLFKNAEKRKETDPDYKGEILVDGNLFWLNAWINKSKGTPPTTYMALKVNPKEQQAPQEKREPQVKDPFDDTDIPF